MKLYFIKYEVSSYSKRKEFIVIDKEKRTKLLDLNEEQVRGINNYLKDYESNHVFNNERVVTNIELINFNLL